MAVFLFQQLYDLRNGTTFSQFRANEAFLLHRSLGHVALALCQGQLSAAATRTLKVHRHLKDLILHGICSHRGSCW